MTITVQAGIRMRDLEQMLDAQRQQLPLDAPQSDRATLGGVLATNFSGPRRLGYGTPRDYLIGIRAVDGRGAAFAGGGRVVKNVAGYDFCRMLIGSMGTLAVITEVTLKLKPRPERRLAMVVAPRSRAELQSLLEQTAGSAARPVGLEWLLGPAWQPLADQCGWPKAIRDVGWLLVLLEGMNEDVAWMIEHIAQEWRQTCSLTAVPLDQTATDQAWRALTEFPAGAAPLVLKASVLPSATLDVVERVLFDCPDTSVQAHAGSGIVMLRVDPLPRGGVASTLVSRWRPAAAVRGGNIVVLSHAGSEELTRQAHWGKPSGPLELMRRIKDAFDPFGILNPDRFVV
jgi:glycolate oxidase FAD binding subunit